MQEQKIALIGILRQASEAIKIEAMATEVNTVAEALHLASDEQFAKMVDSEKLARILTASAETVKGTEPAPEAIPDGKSVTPATEQTAPEASGASAKKEELPDVSKSIKTNMVEEAAKSTVRTASEVAGEWNIFAHKAVLAKLASIVTDRPDVVPEAQPAPEAIPDGKSVTPATEQTAPEASGASAKKEELPDVSKSIETNMVEEAGKVPVDTMEGKEASSEEDEKPVEEKEASASKMSFAGIEFGFGPSMEPAQLGAADSALNGLFS